MDSRLMYTASEAVKNKISWARATPGSEWAYIGVGDDINKDDVFASIEHHFTDDTLYLVFDRTESVQTTKQNIETDINNFLGTRNFLIWDADFNKAIEFNIIGTMRCGQLKTLPN